MKTKFYYLSNRYLYEVYNEQYNGLFYNHYNSVFYGKYKCLTIFHNNKVFDEHSGDILIAEI